MAEEDRPREKMVAIGKKSLTNSELLAILLRTGVHGATAIDIAQNLLRQCDNRITELARLEINDLAKMQKGLGMAKSVTVLAALELGNRMMKEAHENPDQIIKSSVDLFNFIAPILIDLNHEEFWAVYLNQRNKVVQKKLIGTGGLTQTTVDLRIIYKWALEYNAVALTLVHNHPSGRLLPSKQDKELTQHISEAGNILRIKVMDHLIVGHNEEGRPDYYSFSEHGIL